MIFDPLYLIMIAPLFLLTLWAGARVKSTFAKYHRVPLRSGVSGGEAAQMILRAAGIHGVEIGAVPGALSDHYDPRTRRISMSVEVLNGRSAAAVAVAAHEVGHAIQHAQGYAPMSIRHSLVPVANLGSSLAIPMIIGGFLFHLPGLAYLGVFAFAFAVLFHLVTLPVEFDASRRALRFVEGSGIAAADEMVGVRKTLYAAGFTYVASALVALLELVYWLMRTGILGGSRD
jgi:hypothetical protein